MTPHSLDLQSLATAYRQGLKPSDLFATLLDRASRDKHHTWISLLPAEKVLAMARRLDECDATDLPLYGVPFAIKDNIDLAGHPTTAACPDFCYIPESSATVVAKLMAAGAIPLGKTNMDQFATGLNGTRSPYGACRNAFNPAYISGGSSAGSAVAVACGQVSFSLGTDTAGSGRVPAAFNNLVGLKPSGGLLSTKGIVPACRSLDAVSIFALTAADAQQVFAVAQGYDEDDPYSRPAQPHGRRFQAGERFRFGVPQPAQLAFFGDGTNPALFAAAVARMEALGGTGVPVDFAPFLAVARLLYDGPWVAERYHAIRSFIDKQPESVFPVTRAITLAASKASAVDAFDAFYALKNLQRQCAGVWEDLSLMLTPTAGFHPSIAAIEADPIGLNTHLGYYTNFMNLLGYSAVALPAAFRPDGLPFGVSIFAQADQDIPLLELAARWQASTNLPLGASGQPLPPAANLSSPIADGQIRLAVCGAHLSGLPLNWQLVDRGARLIATVRSAAEYQLYALPGGPPLRPGMVRVDKEGVAIDMEVWEMPGTAFGSFVAAIPSPLGIGKIRLADGSEVCGFLCETAGVAGAENISRFGGWRAWLGSR